MVKKFLLEIIRILIHLSWAIIGMIFWIPFLARVTTVFIGSILLSVSKGNSMTSAEKTLNAGIIFYIDGFKKINSSINNVINENYNNVIDSKSTFMLADILIEISYTIIFWIVTLFIITSIFLPIK